MNFDKAEKEALSRYNTLDEIDAFRFGAVYGSDQQKSLDIETIPQLFIRWLMIDGDKPIWKDYAIKEMKE